MQKLISFPNGLKLAFVKNSAVRSVAIGIFAGAGVVTETPEIAGISHFIEHMMFKGTPTRSSFDIANEIDSIGAQINAFTAKSYTCYYTVSMDTHAKKCAEVLSDMYFNALFDAKELDNERKIVLEEINESQDTPDDLCLENLSSAFFKGHPLETPILGNKKSLGDMTSETLKGYVKKHYTPSNTVVAIAGNLSEKDAVEIASEYFEAKFPSAAHAAREAVTPAETRQAFVTKQKDIEQTHIGIAFPTYSYSDNRSIAVQVIASVFGMEMSSRLFQSVREKLGLCYTIMAYPSTYENNGMFVIYTSTSPHNAEKAVKAIKIEIDKLLADGITEAELNKGKEQLKASLVLGQESTSSMMRAFGRHAVQTGELYDINSRISHIDALKNKDILSAARYIFDMEKSCVSTVAKKCDVDLLTALKS
jgi:predicted Zn-dependent peptidase